VSACVCMHLCALAFACLSVAGALVIFASDINCVQLWIALFVELQVLETFN